MWTVRYVLPAALLVAGLVIYIADPSDAGFEAFIMFIGAGLSVLLLNILHRIGVSGDRDRDREELARMYFDEHGRWPDDEPEAPRGRTWTIAPGVEVAEPDDDDEPPRG